MAAESPSPIRSGRHWVLSTPAVVVSQCCVFLDVDGTLVDLSDKLETVPAPEDLTRLLRRSARVFDGALALVSGRTIAALDAQFFPLRLPVAGIHGIERRDARGRVHRAAGSPGMLDPARQYLRELIALHPGLRFEDKGSTLALHFRRRPDLAEESRRIASALAAQAGPTFHVQEGSMVFEIKPSGISKATAIEAFMRESPFSGRVPVAVGDDLSDSDAFAAVGRLGGVSIAVGGRIAADCTVESFKEIHRWLSALCRERD